MKGEQDGWRIRKYDNKKLVETLRDPFACEPALTVALTEAIARILESLNNTKK